MQHVYTTRFFSYALYVQKQAPRFYHILNSQSSSPAKGDITKIQIICVILVITKSTYICVRILQRDMRPRQGVYIYIICMCVRFAITKSTYICVHILQRDMRPRNALYIYVCIRNAYICMCARFAISKSTYVCALILQREMRSRKSTWG